jgi:hypothetical protein
MDFAVEGARTEVSRLPREPARATHRRPKSPPNRLPRAARRRAPLVREISPYELSWVERRILALAGRAEGGLNGAKQKNEPAGEQPSPRATLANTPSICRCSSACRRTAATRALDKLTSGACLCWLITSSAISVAAPALFSFSISAVAAARARFS